MEWHNLLDPADPELDRLAERYHLHPLHVEDCRHRKQSAKIEESEDYIFTVVKGIRVNPDGSLDTPDLDIFLGRDYLLTVLEEECPEVRRLIEQTEKAVATQAAKAPSKMRADQLYYRIVDQVVDSYLPVLDRFGEMIDQLQDEALQNPTPSTLARIFEAKRALMVMRRVLVNTRDVAGHLQRTTSPMIRKDMWPFLRDIYDHVARSLDTVEVLRDLLNGSLDVYLSSVANQTNQVVKVLTVLSTIALPVVVLSGIWGMNLKGLPWSDAPHGVAIVTGLMVLATIALLALLRRFRWL